MSNRVKSFFAIICVVVILASMMSGFAFADGDVQSGIIYRDGVNHDAAETYSETEPDDGETLILAYTEIPLYVDDNFIGTGFKFGSVTYVPLRAFCQSMLLTDFEAVWDPEEDSVELSAEGISISLKLSDNFIVANGRYLYLPEGAYNINGTIMVPIRELAKIFNVSVEWDEECWSVDIDASELEIIQSGEEFYDEESLYWLSRVISTEAGAEPLDGMIGVGNVVQNRASDEGDAWPDTIEDVLFQPGQFAVAESGAIYLEPNEMSVIAAKLCLEGYNTVGDSKFFLNPEKSSSTWFQKYRTFVVTIEDHDFYA